MNRRLESGFPGPTLYRLASERRYDEIPGHVEAHPLDVFWKDQYGSTALHVICRSQQIGGPLLRAVDSILQEAPYLAGERNMATWTPLHLACDTRLLWRNDVSTEQLILKLIDACPDAVSEKLQSGFKAKTPFHICCETDTSPAVLRAMLRINPRLATQPYNQRDVYTTSENPLQILWNTLNKTDNDEVDISKIEILLRAAYSGTVEEEEEEEDGPIFRIVCAICSIRCPREYVTRVLFEHADQISEPDNHGLYPLHYAIKSADEGSQSYTNFLIEQLVAEFPQAATIPFGPSSHVLPLHALLKDKCMTWHTGGVQHLVLASSEVLRIPDPRSRLVPFMESAIHATASRLHLSTTFELLRCCPEVIQFGFATAVLEGKSL